ncbi:MAG TPA: hypothetical protein VHE37_00240 [Nevskiaceae bacterium]|nr:hypothetical protein [Nevskiaceae bacterium]
MRNKTVVLGLLGCVLSVVALHVAAKGKQLVCWTDKDGVRACGDSVPPEYAKQDRDVLNAQGQVVGTMAREKTAAELAEEQRQAEAAAAEQRRHTRQLAYDNYMLQSYESVTQLQKVRDDNLTTIDGRLALAEKAVPGAENALNGVKARNAAEDAKDAKDHVAYASAEDCIDPQIIKDKIAARAAKLPPPKPVKGKAPPPPKDPPELKAAQDKWNSRECGQVRRGKLLAQFEQSLVDALKAVQSLKKQREDTAARYELDIARFKKLRSHEVMVGSVDPNAPQGGAPAVASSAATP